MGVLLVSTPWEKAPEYGCIGVKIEENMNLLGSDH